MKISHPEHGGNGESLGVVNQRLPWGGSSCSGFGLRSTPRTLETGASGCFVWDQVWGQERYNMPPLTRRRLLDNGPQCWQIYHGDLRGDMMIGVNRDSQLGSSPTRDDFRTTRVGPPNQTASMKPSARPNRIYENFVAETAHTKAQRRLSGI